MPYLATMGDVGDGPVSENQHQAQSGPVMSAFVAACPSFKNAWRAHQAEAIWVRPLVYLDIAPAESKAGT